MDARAVAEAARIGVGTLNVWVQRGSIPGMTVGSRGRQRDFDLDTAIHIAIMSELVRAGVSAPAASRIATEHRHSKKILLFSDVSPHPNTGTVVSPATITEYERSLRRVRPAIPFKSEEDLPKFFEQAHIYPAVYTVINIEQIVARMQRTHEEWEQVRETFQQQWEQSGSPVNALRAYAPPSTESTPPAAAPTEADASPGDSAPAPSKPPPRRSRRKKTQ
jgi:hypothetical protein